MAIVNGTFTDDFVRSKSARAFWETLTETNNFSNTFTVSSLRDMTVHVYGNFGTNGSLTVFGSNDPADIDTTPVSSTKWVPVALAKNGNAATFTAFGGGQLLDNYDYICVGVTAGTGVDLDVRLKATHERQN